MSEASPANGPRAARCCLGRFDRDHIGAQIAKDHPADQPILIGQVQNPVVAQHRTASAPAWQVMWFRLAKSASADGP